MKRAMRTKKPYSPGFSRVEVRDFLLDFLILMLSVLAIATAGLLLIVWQRPPYEIVVSTPTKTVLVTPSPTATATSTATDRKKNG